MKRRSRLGGKLANAPKAVRPRSPSATREEAKLRRFTRERDEAMEQLAAASEVLRVISTSPADLQPVFETMLDNASASAVPLREVSAAGTTTPFITSLCGRRGRRLPNF